MIEKNPNRFILDPKYSVVASFENPNPSGVPNTNIYTSNGNLWIGEIVTGDNQRVHFYKLVESGGVYSFQERIPPVTYPANGTSDSGWTYPVLIGNDLYVLNGRATFSEFNPTIYRADPDTGAILNQYTFTLRQGRLFLFPDVTGTIWGTQENKLYRFDTVSQVTSSSPAFTLTTAFFSSSRIDLKIIKQGEGNLVYYNSGNSGIVTPDPTVLIFEGDNSAFFADAYQVQQANGMVPGANDRVYVSSSGGGQVIAKARYNNDVIINEWQTLINKQNTRPLYEGPNFFYGGYDDTSSLIDRLRLLRMDKDTGAVLEETTLATGNVGQIKDSVILSQDIIIILSGSVMLACSLPDFTVLAQTTVGTAIKSVAAHPFNNYRFTVENS